MPVQASIQLLALCPDSPIQMLANPPVPVSLCDCDYEETKPLLCEIYEYGRKGS